MPIRFLITSYTCNSLQELFNLYNSIQKKPKSEQNVKSSFRRDLGPQIKSIITYYEDVQFYVSADYDNLNGQQAAEYMEKPQVVK